MWQMDYSLSWLIDIMAWHDSLHGGVEDGPAVLQEEVAGARRPAELHQQLHGPPRRPRPGLRRLVRRQLGLQCNGEWSVSKLPKCTRRIHFHFAAR